jgi:hypothetical protein
VISRAFASDCRYWVVRAVRLALRDHLMLPLRLHLSEALPVNHTAAVDEQRVRAALETPSYDFPAFETKCQKLNGKVAL